MQLTLEIFRSAQADDPFAFRAGEQEYVFRTPLGGAETATLNWDDGFLSDLQALRRIGAARDPILMQRVGVRLRRFLATTSFPQSEREIEKAVERGEPVLITLRLAAAELFSLPWELLALQATGKQLGALPGVLLRYAWPDTETTRETPSPRPAGGRILYAWSAAGGAVPAGEQLAAIERACERGEHTFDVARDVIPNVSFARLHEALAKSRDAQEESIAILHILCHGSERRGSFGLAWDVGGDNADGEPVHVVDAGQLRQLLAPHADRLRLVVLTACDSANSGQLGNQLGSIAQTLHRAGIAAVVASRYPLSIAGSIELSQTFYEALLVRPASLEVSFLLARKRLQLQPSAMDWAALQLYARPEDGDDSRPLIIRPYRGLLPFLKSHSRFFFGRERERQQAKHVLESLQKNGQPRFLVVAGASGTGKSSVVLGGLIPDLTTAAEPQTQRRGSEARRAVAQLTQALGEHAENPPLRDALHTIQDQVASLSEAGGPWEATVIRPGTAPLAALQTALRSRRDKDIPFLLCVDQLEELFTHTSDTQTRDEFIRRLWALSREPTGVFCVVTLRVDFLGHCGELILDESGLRLDKIAYAEAHRVFVAQLEPAQLAEAILGPAELVGLEVSTELLQRMIGEVEGEPGALPMLEYLLDLLWQQRQERRLSEVQYAELGGVGGALGRAAERVLASLDAEDQRLSRQLLVELVHFTDTTGAETRRRISLKALYEQIPDSKSRLDVVLTAFVDARLLVRGEEHGDSVIEVAHEALIRKWPRLQEWLSEDRQKLAELRELQQWAAQFKEFGTLLRGSQLGYARRIQHKYQGGLGKAISEMIARSVRTERRRRLRVSIVVISALSVLTMLSLYAWRSQQLAVRQREVAIYKERIAEGRLLGIRAERALDTQPDVALLLATGAYRLHQEPSSRGVLESALERSHLISHFLRGPRGAVHSIAFSADGKTLAATGQDSEVWLFDTESGALRQRLQVGAKKKVAGSTPDVLNAVAFSQSGLIAAAGNSGRIFLWDLMNLKRPAEELPAAARMIYSLDWSPGSALLAAGTEDGQVLLFDIAKRRAAPPLSERQPHLISALSFRKNGPMWLAVGDSAGGLSIFDVTTQKPVQERKNLERGALSSVSFSHDGRFLAVGSEDRSIVLIKTDEIGNGELHEKSWTRHQSAVSDVSFSADSQFIASCGLDRVIHLSEVASGRTIGKPLRAHSDPIYSCTFSPDGRRLASGSDNLILLWDIAEHPALMRVQQPIAPSALAVDPSGKHAVIGTAEGNLRMWDLSQPQPGTPQPAHAQAINAVTYSAAGDLLVSGSVDGEVRLMASATLQLRQHFTEPGKGGVMALALNAAGDTLAVGFADGTLLRWNVAKGERQGAPIQSRQQSITALSFGLHGRTLLSGGLDGSLRFYVGDESRCHIPLAHSDAVSSFAHGADGRYLVSAGRDRRILLWSEPDETGGCPTAIGELPIKHSGGITSVSISRDGLTLASGGEDASVILWDISTRQPIGIPLSGHLRPLTAVAFAKDNLLLSADDETLRRWDLAESAWPARACRRANRNLSLGEWQQFVGDSAYCRICPDLPSGTGAPPKAPACKETSAATIAAAAAASPALPTLEDRPAK